MAPTNDVVEDEPNDSPGDVVHCRRWRDETRSVEDNGEVHVFDDRVGPLEVDEIRSGGCERSSQEEEHKTAAPEEEREREKHVSVMDHETTGMNGEVRR